MDIKSSSASVVLKPKVLRVLNGLLNGCEFAIDSERFLVVVGSDTGFSSIEPFTMLPDDTLFIPQDEEGINFEIITGEEDGEGVKLRELNGTEATERNIALNCRVQVGRVIFALRGKEDEWSSDILGETTEKPVNKQKGIQTKRRLCVFAISTGMIITLIASGLGYWLYSDWDNDINRLNKILANQYSIMQGSDKALYIYSEDQNKAIWVNKLIKPQDFESTINVIYPEKEKERIYSWLRDNMPKMKYFCVHIDNTWIPKLLISKQRSHMSEQQLIDAVIKLKVAIPYAKDIEIIDVSDDYLVNQAEEGLSTLGIHYKHNKVNDYVTYSIVGELSDSELIRLQHFIDGFYHQWGKGFINFNISLEDNFLKNKSFGYGEYNYMKSGPKQWIFRNEDMRGDI